MGSCLTTSARPAEVRGAEGERESEVGAGPCLSSGTTTGVRTRSLRCAGGPLRVADVGLCLLRKELGQLEKVGRGKAFVSWLPRAQGFFSCLPAASFVGWGSAASASSAAKGGGWGCSEPAC